MTDAELLTILGAQVKLALNAGMSYERIISVINLARDQAHAEAMAKRWHERQIQIEAQAATRRMLV